MALPECRRRFSLRILRIVLSRFARPWGYGKTVRLLAVVTSGFTC